MRRIHLILVVLCSSPLQVLAAEPLAVLKISAGDRDRSRTLLHIPAPKQLEKAMELEFITATGDSFPVQTIGSSDKLELVFVVPHLRAREQAEFALRPMKTPIPQKMTVILDNEGNPQVLDRDKPVFTYRAALQKSPIKDAPYYARNGYIHPLCDPKGREVTDDFSPDHAHQHAMFMAWVNTSFDGKKRDFWNQHRLQGTVQHKKIVHTSGGPVAALLAAELEHVTLPEKEVALAETWELLATTAEGYTLIDFISKQKCATKKPLKIHKYHYGGFAIRGRRNWLPAASNFLTSDGKNRKDGNHTRPQWCSLFGQVEDGNSSVTVMNNPSNFRAPQHVRLHPTMPYFCYTPTVLGEFEIKPEEVYESHYRLIITAEKPDAALLDRLWYDYANPPKTEWVK